MSGCWVAGSGPAAGGVAGGGAFGFRQRTCMPPQLSSPSVLSRSRRHGISYVAHSCQHRGVVKWAYLAKRQRQRIKR